MSVPPEGAHVSPEQLAAAQRWRAWLDRRRRYYTNAEAAVLAEAADEAERGRRA